MTAAIRKILVSILTLIACNVTLAQTTSRISLEGLEQSVEILKDRWGISHIYAQTEHDLFFAQGYSAARDRLFQFEIWRAQATGTAAEILGPRAIDRDHGTRLFKFRGDMTQEMNHYHPNGAGIITAFVAGVNAYIDEALTAPDDLPLPFHLLGIEPKLWTPEVVISRHQGLLGNIGLELNTGRAVCTIVFRNPFGSVRFGIGTGSFGSAPNPYRTQPCLGLGLLEEDTISDHSTLVCAISIAFVCYCGCAFFRAD